jgi:Phage tail tube protein
LFKNGTIFRSLFIELMLAKTSFLRFHGMMIDEMTLNFAAREIVTGTWTFMGKESSVVSVPFYEPVRAVGVNPVMNATSNVAGVIIDGKQADVGISAITLTCRNNLRTLPAIGYKSAFGVGSGRFEVTGTMNCYFKDTKFYNKFIKHERMNLYWQVRDANGTYIDFSVPDCRLGPAGSPAVEGINTDVMMTFDWQAQFNPTINATITSTLSSLSSTTTTAAFVQPAINATVVVAVAETRANGFVTGQVVHIPTGGYYQITAWAPNSMTIRNVGHAENAAPAANIASGSKVTAIPSIPS